MVFCDVSEVIPKSLMAVIPERYKKMRYHKAVVGDKISIIDITIVSYQAKVDGDPLVRRDGTPVLNQTCYFGLSDGTYTSIRNDKILGQVAMLTGWIEDGIKEDYYKLDNPENVEIIEVVGKMGNKEVPFKVFKSI